LQGEEAKKNLNVFHHLTYEGAEDLDSLTTPMQRNATISIINNFGQTPKQLFKRPHPMKRFSANGDPASFVSRANAAATKLVSAVSPLREIDGPVGDLAAEKLIVVGTGQLLLPPACVLCCCCCDSDGVCCVCVVFAVLFGFGVLGGILFTKTTSSWYSIGFLGANRFNRRLSWRAADMALVSGSVGGAERAGDYSVYEGLHVGRITACVAPSNRVIVTGGADTTVRVWATQVRCCCCVVGFGWGFCAGGFFERLF
jgi:hypothetical protein